MEIKSNFQQKCTLKDSEGGIIKCIGLNNKFLAAANLKNNIIIWDLDNLNEEKMFEEEHKDNISSLSLSKNEKYLASGTKYSDNFIRIFDVENQSYLKSIEVKKSECLFIKFSDDSNSTLFVVTDDCFVKKYDIETEKEIDSLEVNISLPNCANISKNSKFCAIGNCCSKICIINLSKKISVIKNLELNNKKLDKINCLSFNQEEDCLIFSVGKIIYILNDFETNENKILIEHRDTVKTICFGNTRETIISSGDDKLIIVWVLNNNRWEKQKIININIHEIPDYTEILSNGKTLISSSKKSPYIILWNLEVGLKKMTILLDNKNTNGGYLCLNKNNTHFMIGCSNKKILFKKIINFENFLEIKYALGIIENNFS